MGGMVLVLMMMEYLAFNNDKKDMPRPEQAELNKVKRPRQKLEDGEQTSPPHLGGEDFVRRSRHRSMPEPKISPSRRHNLAHQRALAPICSLRRCWWW